MGKKKTMYEESAKLNGRNYGHYLMTFADLAMSSFEWEGLPKTVNIRFLELTLFTEGNAVFFKDEDLSNTTGVPDLDNEGTYLALQVITSGRLNVYREPINYEAYAPSYIKPLNNENSVIIYNNYLHSNTLETAKIFARRLYNIDRIIQVNVNAQKTPVVIVCDDTERLSFINIFKEIDGNAPAIFGSKNIDLNKIKGLNLNAPYVSDKLYELKTNYWNDALTLLGITNQTYEKKERMLKDEVLRGAGGTFASRYSRLKSRKEACEKINAIFGLNVDVRFNDGADLEDKSEEGKNGKVYNTDQDDM